MSIEVHPDDIAVNEFAKAMKEKLAEKRKEGYSAWDSKELCSQQFLSDLLRSHVEKGDPIDVANFCMMLHSRQEKILKISELDFQKDCRVVAKILKV